MGFFDFLTGNREQLTLAELAKLLGGGKVAHKRNEGSWEWTGEIAGLRARVQLGGARPEAQIVGAHGHGGFVIERNPDLVEDAGETPAAAWSENDHVRLFLGPGTYLESFAFAMPEEMAAFESLPEAGGRRLVDAMASQAVQGVNVGPEETLIHFAPESGADRIAAFLRLVAGVLALPTTAAAVAARSAAGEGAGLEHARIECGYCRCCFLLGADGKCPNCGGPAGG